MASADTMRPGRDTVAPCRFRPWPDDAAVFTPSAEPARGVSRHLREKLAVLATFPGRALLARAGFDPGPALAAWAAQAARDLPGVLQQAADGRLEAPRLGWAVDAAGAVRPGPGGAADWPEVGPLLNRMPRGWRRAGLLSLACAEDVAVAQFDAAADAWRLQWMIVALPSGWAPEQQLGLPFDGLPRELPAGRRWTRERLALSPQPWLHGHPLTLPCDEWPQGNDALAIERGCWLRRERQFLLPLAAAGAGDGAPAQALIVLRVDSRRLGDALAADPGLAVALQGEPLRTVPTALRQRLAAGLPTGARAAR